MSDILPRLWIDQLTFSDGSRFILGPDDIVVIVGPNNSGKSATLRAISEKLSNPNSVNPVVSSIGTQSLGTADDVIAWLEISSLR